MDTSSRLESLARFCEKKGGAIAFHDVPIGRCGAFYLEIVGTRVLPPNRLRAPQRKERH